MPAVRKPKILVISTRVTTAGFASGASAAAAVHSLPANAFPIRALIECESPMTFSAGTTTGATATLGRSGSASLYLSSGNLGAMTAGQKSVLGGQGAGAGVLDTTARDVLLTITPTGGAADADEISGGVFWVHQEYEIAPDRVG
ncbi:MAG: hypothetical protein IPH07_24375 [Deltaproteobacteria bacterium]|nr:hypothetical protein [Deltaproteobacteria bacterium]